MREQVAVLSQDAKTDEQFQRCRVDRFAGRAVDDLCSADHASRTFTASFTPTGSIRLRRFRPTILS